MQIDATVLVIFQFFFFLAECEFSGIYFIIKLNEISLIISLIKNMIYILLYISNIT